jgi:hypothetical protein
MRRPVAPMNRILIGAGLLVVVVLTHVAEAYKFMPWMGWGLPNSPGHYLDLVSAIGGVVCIASGVAKCWHDRRAIKTGH